MTEENINNNLFFAAVIVLASGLVLHKNKYIVIEFFQNLLITLKWLAIAVGTGSIAFLISWYIRKLILKLREKLERLKNIEEDTKTVEDYLRFDPFINDPENIKAHIDEQKSLELCSEVYLVFHKQLEEHISFTTNIIIYKQRIEELEGYKEEFEKVTEEYRNLEIQVDHIKQEQEMLERDQKDKFLQKQKNNLFVYKDELDAQQCDWLIETGYIKTKQWCPIEKDLVDIFVKPRSNESISHAFIIGVIYKYLKNEIDDASLYETKMPDIVFKANNQTWAIEVETGSMLKNPKDFEKKTDLLKRKFNNNWFFVVTNYKLLNKYRKYGIAYDRKNVIEFLDSLLF